MASLPSEFATTCPQRWKTKHMCSHTPIMPPLNPTTMSLVRAVINLMHDTQSAAKRQTTARQPHFQRRNIAIIIRRINILLMLFEEIQDTDILLPPSATVCFGQLHVVIQGIKLLIAYCADSSRLWLLMEHHNLSEQFLELTHDMANALDILPLSLLDVSFEVREQVELVLSQAGKATLQIDPEEAELWSQVQSAMLAIENKKTPNLHKLADIFRSLRLDSAVNCQKEVDKIMEKLQDDHEEEGDDVTNRRVSCVNDLVSFVRYCKCVLYGATDIAIIANADAGRQPEEIKHEVEEETKVPDDFRCPISLEVMVDPVIVATGQTYERAAISRWMEGGHDTCPKSGLKLEDNIVIPNYALRSVIRQWCARHRFRLPTVSDARNRAPSSPPPAALPTSIATEATKLTAEFLVRELNKVNTTTPDAARSIVGELRMLAKFGPDNRKLVAEAGAIPALIPFLSSTDTRVQEHAVTAILNLSIYQPNKAVIVKAGAIDRLIKLLHRDQVRQASEAARENSAAALFSLSHVTEYAAMLGQCPGAITGLLELLKQGGWRGKQDALSALFNIAVHNPNRPVLVQAGAVAALVEFLKQHQQQLAEQALAVLAIISGSEEGRAAITAMNRTVPLLLVKFLHTASPTGKEGAASILLYLCRYNNGGVDLISQLLCMCPPLMPCLQNLLSTGTPRATRKAACLIRILRKWEAWSSSSSDTNIGSSSSPLAMSSHPFQIQPILRE